MTAIPRFLLVGSLTLAANLTAHAGPESKSPVSPVVVVFVEPGKYTDIRETYYDADQVNEQVLQEIRAHLERLGSSYLKPGQSLRVRISDVDLAGDFEPWRGLDFDHIRILKEIYPPAMTLEFQLIGADGKVLSEGKRELRELGYLMTFALPSWDRLRFEKEMLRTWMWREFKQP